MVREWWYRFRVRNAEDELFTARRDLREVGQVMRRFDYSEEQIEQRVARHEARVRRAAARLARLRQASKQP